MAVSVSLSASPASPPAGATLTCTYSVAGNTPVPGKTVATTSGEVEIGGVEYEAVTTISPVSTPAAAVTYAVPVCPGLTFAKTSNPAVFTAVVPSAMTATITGSATVGGSKLTATASISAPSSPVTPPVTPASGTVPYPTALATGHELLEQFLPSDLYAWRYAPGTTTPVVNGSGVTEDSASPRNVTVTTDGGLSVLQLACTSTADCGVIQSPGQYPTASGVIEALVKFSGFASGGNKVFADWASLWLFGSDWPANGELDAVETQYGGSYISYHYTATASASSDTATTGPWTYDGKTVQLSPDNTTTVPALPNILPGTWTYVTIGFGQNADGDYYCDVYYNGVLYCTVSGPYVTGSPMWITADIEYGGPVLGSNQTPFDQPGTLELQYVRVFS